MKMKNKMFEVPYKPFELTKERLIKWGSCEAFLEFFYLFFDNKVIVTRNNAEKIIKKFAWSNCFQITENIAKDLPDWLLQIVDVTLNNIQAAQKVDESFDSIDPDTDFFKSLEITETALKDRGYVEKKFDDYTSDWYKYQEVKWPC